MRPNPSVRRSAALYREFVQRWVHADYQPFPVKPEALDRLEARFETYLPLAYRACMEKVGPASAGLVLLSTIVEQRLDIPSVHEFLSPAEALETTKGWRDAGLEEDMVAFATEGSGDMYCFKVVPESEPVPGDATVWYFDHEERRSESLDLLFTEWLKLYAQIKHAKCSDA